MKPALYVSRAQWEKLKEEFDKAALPKLGDTRFINPLMGSLGDISGIPVFILEQKVVRYHYNRHPCNKRVRLKQRRWFNEPS